MRRLLPDRIPLHYRSKWLGIMRHLRRACRRLPQAGHERGGPHRSARLSTRTFTMPIPTGSRSTRSGNKRPPSVRPDFWLTCALGPYNFEFMTAVHKEIMTHVQAGRHLHQSLGRLRHVLLRALPREFPHRSADSNCRAPSIRRIPRARQYIVWRQQRLFELWRVWNDDDPANQSGRAVTSPTPAAARSAIST